MNFSILMNPANSTCSGADEGYCKRLLLYVGQPSAIPIDGAVGQQLVCGAFTSWRCNSDGPCLRKTMNNRKADMPATTRDTSPYYDGAASAFGTIFTAIR